jgi:hypothetical protein
MKNKPSLNQICFKGKRRMYFLLPVFIFLFSSVYAQNAIPVSGGNASGESGSLSYSIGLAIYTAVAGGAGTIAQGVQQPFEISVATGIDNPFEISLEISAYPNPTAGNLNLTVGTAGLNGIQKLDYRLYDLNSRLVQAEKVTGPETVISMGHLLPAMYFLKVISGDNEVKSFKIIKN